MAIRFGEATLEKVSTVRFEHQFRVQLQDIAIGADSCDYAWDPLHGAELLPGLFMRPVSSYHNDPLLQSLTQSLDNS